MKKEYSNPIIEVFELTSDEILASDALSGNFGGLLPGYQDEDNWFDK